MDEQRPLNATAAALLGLLRRHGAMTGGELVRTAETYIGDYWTLTRSQVYRELATLAGRELVLAGPDGPRRARPFAITESGEAAFLAWLESGPSQQVVRLPMLLRVGFADALAPGRLEAILRADVRRHEDELDRYRRVDAKLAAGDGSAYVRATVACGIAIEEAVLSWLEHLLGELA